MTSPGHKALRVWHGSMALVVEVYRLSERFPSREKFGLAAQLRRAVVSVPANVAEGVGRYHRGDLVRHLSIARGSLWEVQTLLDVATRLEYVDAAALAESEALIDSVGRMLSSMMRRMREIADR